MTGLLLSHSNYKCKSLDSTPVYHVSIPDVFKQLLFGVRIGSNVLAWY